MRQFHLPVIARIRSSRSARFLAAGLALVLIYPALRFAYGQEALYHVLGIAPSVAIVYGVRRYRPQQIHAWYVVAAGSASGALGDFIYYGYGWFGTQVPFPGLDDYFYILGDLLIVAGIGAISFHQRRGRGRQLLDAGIVSLAAVLVIYAVVIGPNLDGVGTVFSVTVASLEPILDAALVVVLMPLLLARPRSAALRLLTAYAAFTVFGDTIYGLETLHNTYVGGGLLDLTWLVGFVCLGAAGLSPSLRDVSDDIPQRRWDDWGRLVLLGSATLVALAVVAFTPVRWDVDFVVALFGTAVSVALVFLRIGLLHAEQRAAARRLGLESARLAAVEAVQREVAAADLDLDEFLASVSARAAVLVGAAVSISLLEGGRLIVRSGCEELNLRRGDVVSNRGLASQALAHDEVLISHDTRSDPRTDQKMVAETGVRSLVVAPLHFGGSPIGILAGLSPDSHTFDERDAQTLGLLASLVSVAVNRNAEFAAGRALAEIVESSDDAIIREDMNGTVVAWNHGAEQMFGFTAAEMIGVSIDEIVPPELRSAKDANLSALVRGGVVAPYETERMTKDGRRLVVSLGLAPVRDANGKVVGVSGIARDLTERRALEEQLHQAQKMEAVGRLAGGVAHDFNNLLMAIQGYGSLLLSQVEADPTQRRYAEQIMEAARRSAELTQQLLAYSRKQVLQPKVIDPNLVVEETERLLSRMVGEDVVVTCALDRSVGSVLADRGRLGQVIMNLAVNARDAMPRGGRLTIGTSAVMLTGDEGVATGGAPAGCYSRITVTDTGVGMDKQTLEHIFEPFFTTKGELEGTGLGLATVFGTVSQSGGYIGVRTAPGAGTTFSVYLPEAVEPAPARDAGPLLANAA
jgi:PAS domain S-box-containing protein